MVYVTQIPQMKYIKYMYTLRTPFLYAMVVYAVTNNNTILNSGEGLYYPSNILIFFTGIMYATYVRLYVNK